MLEAQSNQSSDRIISNLDWIRSGLKVLEQKIRIELN